MGQPSRVHLLVHDEYIVMCSQPRELKHLSTWWNRKQIAIPLVVASERGPAQTKLRKSLGVVGPAIWDQED